MKQKRFSNILRNTLVEKNSIFILLAMLIFSGVASDRFFTSINFISILRQQAPYMIVSLGVMMVVMTGGIDLSISQIVAVGSILCTVVLSKWNMDSTLGLVLSVLIPVAVGVCFGTMVGVLVSVFKIKPFIATIASGNIAQGIAYIITKGSPIRLDTRNNMASQMLVKFGQVQTPLLGIPATFVVAIGFVILFYFLMKFTTFGRLIVATGSNKQAAQLAGINVRRYEASAYIISSALAAFVGVLIVARSSMSTPLTAADDYGITAISAVVIGGTSLEGGRGAVPLVVIGVFIMACITNIMNLMSIAAYPQLVVKGLVMVFAVLVRSISDFQMDRLASKRQI